MVDRKQQAEQNRKAYPVTAQIVDDFRKAGFNTVKVLKTNEIKNATN